MKRREFMALFGGASVWSIGARAQQASMPVVGFLSSRSAVQSAAVLAAFREGLGELGFAEGRGVTIEYRWAENQYDRLPSLAADLVRQKVAIIVAVAGHLPALAAKSATTTIPVVFESGNDPIKFGLVKSLSRPEGNLTGITYMASSLASKQLALLHEVAPKANLIGVLLNQTNPNASVFKEDLRLASAALSVRVADLTVSTVAELDTALANFVQGGGGGLLVPNDPFFFDQRAHLVALLASHAMPAIYFARGFTADGGLMSYGASLTDAYHRVGVYTGRILRGEKPADLPVQQPTKFEMVINLKTAKTLGLDIPPSLLALADEVLE